MAEHLDHWRVPEILKRMLDYVESTEVLRNCALVNSTWNRQAVVCLWRGALLNRPYGSLERTWMSPSIRHLMHLAQTQPRQWLQRRLKHIRYFDIRDGPSGRPHELPVLWQAKFWKDRRMLVVRGDCSNLPLNRIPDTTELMVPRVTLRLLLQPRLRLLDLHSGDFSDNFFNWLHVSRILLEQGTATNDAGRLVIPTDVVNSTTHPI